MSREFDYQFAEGENAFCYKERQEFFRSGVPREMFYPIPDGMTALDYPGKPPLAQWPSTSERQANETALQMLLQNCINPETGNLYTTNDLAEIFHLSAPAVTKRFREAARPLQPRIEVRTEPLPQNEMSYFTGLTLGDFEIRSTKVQGKDLVVLKTETKKPIRREVLKRTIGTWGDVRESNDALRIYMDGPTFDFLPQPQIDYDFLRAQSRFAPFILGALNIGLSNKENRLTNKNVRTMQSIHKQFENHFGFPLGHFGVETRILNNNGHGPQPGNPSGVITVRQPERVFAALLQEPSVQRLPFLESLMSIPTK